MYGSDGSGFGSAILALISVSDPYSFFPDPDPEVEAGDQYGSGSGSNQGSRALMTKN